MAERLLRGPRGRTVSRKKKGQAAPRPGPSSSRDIYSRCHCFGDRSPSILHDRPGTLPRPWHCDQRANVQVVHYCRTCIHALRATSWFKGTGTFIGLLGEFESFERIFHLEYLLHVFRRKAELINQPIDRALLHRFEIA